MRESKSSWRKLSSAMRIREIASNCLESTSRSLIRQKAILNLDNCGRCRGQSWISLPALECNVIRPMMSFGSPTENGKLARRERTRRSANRSPPSLVRYLDSGTLKFLKYNSDLSSSSSCELNEKRKVSTREEPTCYPSRSFQQDSMGVSPKGQSRKRLEQHAARLGAGGFERFKFFPLIRGSCCLNDAILGKHGFNERRK